MDNKDKKKDFKKEREYEIIVKNFRKSILELPEEEQNKHWRELGKPVLNDFEDIVIFDKRDFDINYRYKLKDWIQFNEDKTVVDYLKLSINDHKVRLDRLNKLNIEDVVNYVNQDRKPGFDEVTKIYIERFEKNKIAYSRIIEWLEDELLLIKRNYKINEQLNKEINIDLSDTNPHPQIFKETDTYDLFITYSKKHIIDEYSDYSYLFQRLKKEELIHYIKHLDFMEWLFKNSLITERVYNNFTSKGSFKSITKSYSAQRQNNFNNLFY